MVVADTIERNYWHPAFVGAMGLEFVNDKQHLLFDDEHILNHESIMMDLLIIKKTRALSSAIR